MGALGKFGEHERWVGVARDDSREELKPLDCSPNFPSASITIYNSIYAQVKV